MPLTAYLAEWARTGRPVSAEEISAHPELSDEHKRLLLSGDYDGLREAIEAEGMTGALPGGFALNSWRTQ